MPSQNQQYSNAMAISRQVCVLAPRHQAHGADDSCCLHKIISAGSSLITAAAMRRSFQDEFQIPLYIQAARLAARAVC
jgi:hypothetical protein